MRLGRFFKIILYAFEVVLLLYIITNFTNGYIPFNEPVYWVGVAVEIGLAWLTYWFWMRSLLVKGFKTDRIMAIITLILGFALPNICQLSGLEAIKPAAPSDLFFYFSLVALIIYSSFIIDKYLAKHSSKPSRHAAKKH